MRPKILIGALGLHVVASVTIGAAAPVLPPDFVDDTIVTGLNEPVSMTFLPDGRLLFTERVTGNVQMVVNGHLRVAGPVLTVPDVISDNIERGLQGIAVDPRWPQSPYVYVCHTGPGATMRLVRYTGQGELTNSIGENLVFDSPYVVKDDFRNLSESHHGLGLRFGRDGHLLMTVGDDGGPCSVQDPAILQGKLLRLDVSRLPSGAGGPAPFALLIPPGNPFSSPDSAAGLVYAYGLRNPWRFHVDPATGAILLADVGGGDYEELNEVFAGDNFGWPFREGPLVLTWPDCVEPGGPGGTWYDPPILAIHQSEGTGFSAIFTATVYRPIPGAVANWPSLYWGNLFFGNFYHSQLRRMVRSGGGWVMAPAVSGQPTSIDWAMEIYVAVDWLVGPDGSLYWLKMWADEGMLPTSGMLRRIRYTGPPVAVAPEALSARVLSAAPNPFRGQVTLSWRLPLSAPVTIEVFDLAGRRVRRLHDDIGGLEGRTVWDGRDDQGARLSSGLYMARLAHERRLEPVRLLMLH